jgi:hypothetical protein
MKNLNSAEQKRLDDNAQKEVPLEMWGPYLSERQWGTVREDYSANGDAWNYFPHDHARSRIYRWGEDGLGGISDSRQNLCFALALWNGKDPILKERLYGLTNGEGNHGEDCKELYYYLDNLPTHYYMKFLYKYPQAEFPYKDLLEINRRRNKHEPEFELLDSHIFDEGKYFDVHIEYAKNHSEDIAIKIQITNHSTEEAELMLLPTLWFRNRWHSGDLKQKPDMQLVENSKDFGTVKISHQWIGDYFLYFQNPDETLFTENETNTQRLFNVPNNTPFVKDSFHQAIVNGDAGLYQLLKEKKQGTKFSPVYKIKLQGSTSQTVYLRLANEEIKSPFDKKFELLFPDRLREADDFYNSLFPDKSTAEQALIQRQAFAGLLWTKQYYHYDIERWLNGDPGLPPPANSRFSGKNAKWKHLKNEDIISMPDKWEYPWYAAWDLAFHCVPMAMIDPGFAKNQLILMMREWYMSPMGQIPAYEWNFFDVNPPVHAWAALNVYRIERTLFGKPDIDFLKRIFQKLLINFTWWINRKDENDNNIFEGGFLGLDNIGVFDRSNLPPGSFLEQVDGTSWMGMYALNMMDIALEIALVDPSFEDVATKFYEHFVLIAASLNEVGLWDDEQGFFYDLLYLSNGNKLQIKVRSMVGLSVLFAVSIINQKKLKNLPDFIKRMDYFTNYRLKNNYYLPSQQMSEGGDVLISLVSKEKLTRILQAMLDENEFLSPGGLRALSRFHYHNPYHLHISGMDYDICYVPGESDSGMFGGNSNWRGPVWMPVNYLIIKALKKYYEYYGDSLQVEYPTGSGKMMNLKDISDAISARVVHMFEEDENGDRPVHRDSEAFYRRPENKNLLLFYEYFHGDTARGVGASHQTGWTAVVAEFINDEPWEWE